MVTWAGGGGGYCLRALFFPLSAPVADRTGQNMKLYRGMFLVVAPPTLYSHWLDSISEKKTGCDWLGQLSVLSQEQVRWRRLARGGCTCSVCPPPGDVKARPITVPIVQQSAWLVLSFLDRFLKCFHGDLKYVTLTNR